MLIALLSDSHYGTRGDSPAFHDYFEKFYSQCFFPYLKEHNITFIMHLGDAFDRRKYINYYTLKRMKEYFVKPIMDNKYCAIINVGNHDSYYKNTLEINAIDLNLKEFYPTIHSVTKPTEYEFEGERILMMPWICDANYEESMIALRTSKAKACFGHFEIDGFEMHKGMFHVGSTFDRTLLDKFEFVASGHFHHRSTSGNINYLGCPYEMSWSDYGDPKGFHVYDTTTKKLKFIPNPFKMFQKIYYDDQETTLKQLMDINFEQFADTQVKVVVKNKENPYWFDKFISALENENPSDIQIVEDSYNFNVEAGEQSINEAESTIDILKKYVGSIDIDVDKEQLVMLLSDIYEEALDLQ